MTSRTILRWLGSGFDPAISDLYASVSVSPRQLQRICRRFFGVPPGQLPGQPVVTQSPRMLARYGTGSVAEAAALAAAGPHSALSVTRLVADDGSATLALAVGQGGPLNCCLAHASQAKNQGATA